MSHVAKLLAVPTMAVFMSTPAQADTDEIHAVKQAKISLVEAIHAAEQYQGGRAFEASLDDDSFTPTYEVSLLMQEKLYDVRIDAVSGAVLSAREDKDD